MYTVVCFYVVDVHVTTLYRKGVPCCTQVVLRFISAFNYVPRCTLHVILYLGGTFTTPYITPTPFLSITGLHNFK